MLAPKYTIRYGWTWVTLAKWVRLLASPNLQTKTCFARTGENLQWPRCKNYRCLIGKYLKLFDGFIGQRDSFQPKELRFRSGHFQYLPSLSRVLRYLKNAIQKVQLWQFFISGQSKKLPAHENEQTTYLHCKLGNLQRKVSSDQCDQKKINKCL